MIWSGWEWGWIDNFVASCPPVGVGGIIIIVIQNFISRFPMIIIFPSEIRKPPAAVLELVGSHCVDKSGWLDKRWRAIVIVIVIVMVIEMDRME